MGFVQVENFRVIRHSIVRSFIFQHAYLTNWVKARLVRTNVQRGKAKLFNKSTKDK